MDKKLAPKKGGVIEQRDRFLAFSFATSDLFMEVGKEDRVDFAIGAAKGLTGVEGGTLKGRYWTDIFLEEDRTLLKTMVKNAMPGKRCGPLLATIQSNDKKGERKALVSAIKMPGKDCFYITLAFPNALMSRLGAAEREHEDKRVLLDKESFVNSAQKALKEAEERGQKVDMTLLKMSGLEEMRSRVPEENWDKIMDSLSSILKATSIDGETAAQLSSDSYSVLHDKSIGAEAIQDQVSTMLKESDPEGIGTEVDQASIEASTEGLSERELARALSYSLNEFEKRGTDIDLNNLDEGFKGFLENNKQKIQEFKSMVSNLDFRLFFQPIVSFTDFSVSHYEILTRFEDGGSPYEWITFGEDVGLAADFDMAVCKRAMTYITHVLKGDMDKFAVNISGQSINNERFFETLNDMLKENADLSKQIMFEITESASIEDLDKVNKFIGILQQRGFKVALDDFGAGAASFEYLQKLHVDYVKLDGAYVQQMLESKRNQIMIKSLSGLCKDLEVKMIAERIEVVEEAKMIKDMKVGYGQGYWFSKPLPKPINKVYKVQEKQMTEYIEKMKLEKRLNN